MNLPPRRTARDFNQALLILFDAYVQHGLQNDTTPRYDAAAAKLAWERALAFFRQDLA